MAEDPLKPDLAAAGCDGLWINAWFRLGRRALADYLKVTPRALLSRGADFQTSYGSDKHFHVATATLRVVERFSDRDAAERWALMIQYVPTEQRPGPSPDQKPFASFMKKLGKTGLDIDAMVQAMFQRHGTSIVPQLPLEAPLAGGAFNYVIGFTIARLSEDLNDTLYEVRLRRVVGTALQVTAQFAYRAALAEALVGEVFTRATTLADLVVVPGALVGSEGAETDNEAESVASEDMP